MSLFHLEIVTPDRKVYDGEAEKIILRTVGGDVCIMAHHIDYVAPLGIGECRVTDAEGNVKAAACNGGMLGVSENAVRVMATTFEWSDEIDVERAKKAGEIAKERMNGLSRQDAEYKAAYAKLNRSIARIRTGQK